MNNTKYYYTCRCTEHTHAASLARWFNNTVEHAPNTATRWSVASYIYQHLSTLDTHTTKPINSIRISASVRLGHHQLQNYKLRTYTNMAPGGTRPRSKHSCSLRETKMAPVAQQAFTLTDINQSYIHHTSLRY